ncbi:MAG TPA: energy-coupling factor transporter ATPase [Acetomicrobium sp.]|uniref:energy-coupling factor transporter ATPase n=1 Tax=Acetomicrobium sp. TaxID=1872099 RepID=UPI002B26208C|nr:energy-coupling factor transporter ATPase [Acetomicrobium sp.]HPT65258.1 energy-coupling factor transporter ATPase [Acetomicrobium sp.]HXK99005.1 energy-coupling factor transporter ATPase [Acetomicrobium sp.]
MSEETIFSLRDVTFYYPDTKRPAISGITMDVETGWWVSIVGDNGSGKSTLAKHLNALLVPTQGVCFVLGNDTKDSSSHWKIRKNVSMVFQNPENQIVASVVEEEVAFGPENLGLSSEEIKKRVNWALDVTGLAEFAQKPTYALSGGQKQRLALAGALAMKPKCIVLDEATSMLDPEGRRDLMEVLKKLHEGGMTVVTITHRVEEILMSDYVAVLRQGKLTFYGRLGDVLEDSKLVEFGIKEPAIFRLWRDLKTRGLLDDEVFPRAEDMAENVVQKLCR